MYVDVTLAILRYDIFTSPGGDCWFERELPGNALLFHSIGNNRAILVEEERFKTMIATGQAVRKITTRKARD